MSGVATTGGQSPAAERPGVHARWLKVIGAALVVFGADQLSKWWAVETLAPPPEGDGRVIDLIWGLKLNYAENTGMAFSKGAESGRWIALVVIVITVVMVVVAARATTTAQLVLIGIVIGGALGNLADRLFRATDGLFSGAVVDFINPGWWPVFNVADASVVCGGLLLVWFGTREPARPAASVPDETPETGPPDGG